MEISAQENLSALQPIFQNYANSFENVQTQRLVSKAWLEASAPQWRSLTPIRIVQDPQHGDEKLGTTSICQFLYDTKKNADDEDKLVHRNFTLKYWTVEDAHFMDPAEIGAVSLHRTFWTSYANSITILTLGQCKIPYSFTLIPPIFWKQVPNLDTLSLVGCEMELKSDKSSCWRTRLTQDIILNDKQIEEKISKINDLVKKFEGLPTRGVKRGIASVQIQGNLEALQVLDQKRDELWAEVPFMLAHQKRQTIMRLYSESLNLTSELKKLRHLTVQNVYCRRAPPPIVWSQITNLFPNLMRISVRQQKINKSKRKPVVNPRKLVELDVMQLTPTLNKAPNEAILCLPTERLSFDCGIGTEAKTVQELLKPHAGGLKKLGLLLAPFGELFPEFPCTKKLAHLTELHLWGNVTSNLNFLKLTPQLQVLKWNTSCYDEETHGARLHKMLGQETHLLSADGIVKGTNKLKDTFTLKSLHTLELGTGGLNVISLNKLRNWLPNLKALKAAVDSDDEFLEIAQLWVSLEELTLAHGSRITTQGILHICLTHKLFANLKRFVCKSCACFEIDFDVVELCAENEIKKKCGNQVIFPWNSEPEAGGKGKRVKCLQALFEKALAGGAKNIEEFYSALNDSS